MFGKTTITKPAAVEKKWVLIDASDLVVGRLATLVAMRLRGKHKASFTPHVDDGDNVIVINAEKVHFTGRKLQQKVYHHYTGYIGGIKERAAKDIISGRFPERIVEKAVERMLPRVTGGQALKVTFQIQQGLLQMHQDWCEPNPSCRNCSLFQRLDLSWLKRECPQIAQMKTD